MNKTRCIYCDAQNLTNSDIIPAFLTPKKMVKKFVCTYHNRSVGENYESQLAVMLKPLRNSLGLRNRAGEEFVSVKADIEYDGHVLLWVIKDEKSKEDYS